MLAARAFKTVLLGEGFGSELPSLIDHEIAGDLVQPGAEVAAPEPRREGPPHVRPDFLMQIIERRPADPSCEECDQSPGVPVVKGVESGLGHPPGV